MSMQMFSCALLKNQTFLTTRDCVQMCVQSGGWGARLYLICFLVEAGRHLQQRAAFIQRRSEGLPLLLQLPRDLLDLLRGVMARLQEPIPD